MGSSKEVRWAGFVMLIILCSSSAQNIRNDGTSLLLINVIDTLDNLSLQLKEHNDKMEANLKVINGKLAHLEESQKTIEADIKQQQEKMNSFQQCSKSDQVSDLQDLLATGQQQLESSLSELQDLLATDECEQGKDNCSKAAKCTDSAVHYKCTCLPGYSGDGFSCEDVDECTLETFECDANEKCFNTPGSYTCICQEGYRKEGNTCKGPVCESLSLMIPPLGCIRLVKEKMSWEDGKSRCQKMGMRLAEDLEKDDLEPLLQYLVPEPGDWSWSWVGARNGRWLTSGKEVSQDTWKKGQPTGGNQDCEYVCLHPSDSGVGDDGCSETNYYTLCQSLP